MSKTLHQSHRWYWRIVVLKGTNITAHQEYQYKTLSLSCFLRYPRMRNILIGNPRVCPVNSQEENAASVKNKSSQAWQNLSKIMRMYRKKTKNDQTKKQPHFMGSMAAAHMAGSSCDDDRANLLASFWYTADYLCVFNDIFHSNWIKLGPLGVPPQFSGLEETLPSLKSLPIWFVKCWKNLLNWIYLLFC